MKRIPLSALSLLVSPGIPAQTAGQGDPTPDPGGLPFTDGAGVAGKIVLALNGLTFSGGLGE